MAQVKQDPDAMYIKQDPDSKDTVLADIDDEDLYEDAGDLDFSLAGQSVWISRLPRQLWENWAHLDDDEEIEVGTMRIEQSPTDPNDIKRVSHTSDITFIAFDYTGPFAKLRPQLRLACDSTTDQTTAKFPKIIPSNNKLSLPQMPHI